MLKENTCVFLYPVLHHHTPHTYTRLAGAGEAAYPFSLPVLEDEALCLWSSCCIGAISNSLPLELGCREALGRDDAGERTFPKLGPDLNPDLIADKLCGLGALLDLRAGSSGFLKWGLESEPRLL